MKTVASVVILLFASSLSFAQGIKPCEALKAEIAQKLAAARVTGYTLDIVAKDKDADGKVVGSCDGGAKKIVYTKATVPAKAPAPVAAKP